MRKPLLILSLVGLLTAAFVAPAAAARPDGAGRPTLLSTAISLNASGPYAGQFDTLLSLAGSYDAVVDALSGKQQLTVFAPTDAAFEALFAFAAANNIALTDELVLDVLLYHVAPGRWSADRIVDNDGGELPTLNGDTLDVTIDGGVFIDQAQVIAADVTSSNGFIHAIDAVLLPGS
jgi:uncharacterized surface protein with fasciclin (FAS1) repeats